MNGSERDDGDMPAEIDFSDGRRGRFYRSDTKLRCPIYLDSDVQAALVSIATARSAALSGTANDLLKKAVAILEAGK